MALTGVVENDTAGWETAGGEFRDPTPKRDCG